MLASTSENNGEQKKTFIALVEKWTIAREQFFGEQFWDPANDISI